MTHITKFTGTCEGCSRLAGIYMYSGPVKVTKKLEREFSLLLQRRVCSGCGNPIAVERADTEEGEEVRDIVARQIRAPGAGRKAILVPCRACGTELSSTERRKACPKCGEKHP